MEAAEAACSRRRCNAAAPTVTSAIRAGCPTCDQRRAGRAGHRAERGPSLSRGTSCVIAEPEPSGAPPRRPSEPEEFYAKPRTGSPALAPLGTDATKPYLELRAVPDRGLRSTLWTHFRRLSRRTHYDVEESVGIATGFSPRRPAPCRAGGADAHAESDGFPYDDSERPANECPIMLRWLPAIRPMRPRSRRFHGWAPRSHPPPQRRVRTRSPIAGLSEISSIFSAQGLPSSSVRSRPSRCSSLATVPAAEARRTHLTLHASLLLRRVQAE